MRPRECSYCGGRGPFTREHVIPEFLYRLYPEHKFGYHNKAETFLEYEAVIRDVCSFCNSGPLSELDSYGREFFNQNSCDRTFVSRATLRVVYNYDQLLRWLLKISYNAMRASGYDIREMSKARSYILNGNDMPFRSELLVEVTKSFKVPERQRQTLPDEFRRSGVLPPRSFHVGPLQLAVSDHPFIASRFVGFFSFHFYTFLCPLDTSDQELRSIFRIIRAGMPQAERMSPHATSVGVRVSKTSCHERLLPQLLKELPAWKHYLKDE